MGGKKQKRNPNIALFVRYVELINDVAEDAKLLTAMYGVYKRGGGDEETDEMVEDMLLDIRDICDKIANGWIDVG